MAPEIINLTPGQKLHHEPGQKSLPVKCDMYSFAMLCYEILTGNKPFPNEDDDKVVKTIVIEGKRPELPAYCPPQLKAVITKCWDKTPSDRPEFETICVELEHLKASLETGTSLSSQCSQPWHFLTNCADQIVDLQHFFISFETYDVQYSA